jgi:uncharacterized protein (TIGR02186 family)
MCNQKLAKIMLAWIAITAPLLLAPPGAKAQVGAPVEQSLEVGAAETDIFIEPDFTGTRFVIFGALDGKRYRLMSSGTDLAILVRGPSRPTTVWRKRKMFGIWMNDTGVTFEQVPSFYIVLSTRPLTEVAPVEERLGQALGLDALNLQATESDRARYSESEIEGYREALIRQKMDRGLYDERISGIEFLGDRLFRARIELPAFVPPGTYRASVFLLDDKEIVTRSSSYISLTKAGIERILSTAAVDRPLLYGIAAVLLASLTGVLATLVLRRSK